VVGLISGGKDSLMSIIECVKNGHEIVALGNLHPSEECESEELDSYMFQTVGVSMTEAIADCMELPLVRRAITGASVRQTLEYANECQGDEVEDLLELLKTVKERFPQVDAVCSGAILSTYQRNRVENVCKRLGLTSFGFLWQREQREVLHSMISQGVDAVLVKVASMGLETNMLGRHLSTLVDKFDDLNEKFGFHVCGEGGEYETITLDCPLFKKRIVIDEAEKVLVDDIPFSPVAHLRIKSFHLEDKESQIPLEMVDPVVEEAVAPCENVFQEGHDIPFPPKFQLAFSETGDIFWLTGCYNVCDEDSSIEEEVVCVMDKLEQTLNSSSTAMENVCFVHLYLSDMGAFQQVNGVYCKYFEGATAPPPSRACVETRMPEGVRVMINVFGCKGKREVLHVRSISNWAPVCIGPYAQANILPNISVGLVAGQIALDPASMKVLDRNSPKKQLSLCVTHCSSIFSCINSTFPVNAVSSVVYVATKFHEEIDAISTQFKALVAKEHPSIVVCVPRLPRDVSVEVEAVASTIADPVKRFSEVSTVGNVQLHCTSASNTKCTHKMICAQGGKPQEESAEVLYEGIFSKLICPSDSIRLLYVSHDPFASQIARVACSSSGGVSFSAVPVDSIASNGDNDLGFALYVQTLH